jgi:hypothetical protein
MTSQAKMATGAYVLYNGTVYAELTEIVPPSFSVEKVDATSHDSTHKVSIAGQSAFGDLTFKANFVNDTAQAALRVLALAKTVGVWRFVYPTSSGLPTYSCPGFVSSLSITAPLKGAPAGFSVSITPTEAVSEITGAGTPVNSTFFALTDEDSVTYTPSPAYAATTYSYDITMLQAVTATFQLKALSAATAIYIDGLLTATDTLCTARTYTLADWPTGSVKSIFVVCDGAGVKPVIYRFRLTRGTA